MSELDEIRRRVRNIWGAISSDQIVDKDVEGQAKRLLAYIDELRRAPSPSPSPGVVEATCADDRARPLLLAQAAKRGAFEWRYEDVESVIAALLAKIDAAPSQALDGAAMIAIERRRQIEEEGWTAEHDDAEYRDGELGRAAVAYALSGMKVYQLPVDFVRRRKAIIADIWPWGKEWFKPRGKPDAVIRSLVKAGALIAAEIDQQQRRAALASLSQPAKGEREGGGV